MKLLKFLAVTGTKQDEQVLKFAERMERDRVEACAEIRARIQKNTVYCKQSLAEAKKIGAQIVATLEDIDLSGIELKQSRHTLMELRRNADAQTLLDARKGEWQAAIRDWMDASNGKDPTVDNDNPGTEELAKLLVEHLARGEQQAAKNATAVITYHPWRPISEVLVVAAAAEEMSGFKTGQILRKSAKNKSPEVEAVWTVLETGSAVLSNPYDHPEEAASAFSAVPLFSTSKHRFGVIVSGPPAMPDEYLEKFATTAGQMFERSGKLEIVGRIISNVQTFIEEQCISAHKLVYVRFVKGAGPTKVQDEWAWQPLEYMHPTNDKRFELPLKFEGGEPIGLFTVECGTFTKMDEQLIALLHTTAKMLIDAVSDVAHMELGYEFPLSYPGKVLSEYEKRYDKIGDVLASELSRCVKTSMAFYNSIVEAATYCTKVDDADTRRLMQAILALASKPCGDWATVRKELKKARELVEALATVGLMTDAPALGKAATMPNLGTAKEEKAQKPLKKSKSAKKCKNASRWNLAESYVKGIDFSTLEDKSPVPICILIRWFKAARRVYNICVTLAMPKDEVVNPLCAKIFKEIDADGSGTLSTKEMIKYMASEFDAEAVMKLLKVIDSNSDGQVTWEEWLQAWQNGDFDVETSIDDDKSKTRLLSKHLTKGRGKVMLPPMESASDEVAAAPSADPGTKGAKAKRTSSAGKRDKVAPNAPNSAA